MSEDYKNAKELRLTDKDRWEEDIAHHPMSERIVRFLAEHDLHDYGDYFCWKVGGDGDNGETLAYQLDAFFELLDNKDVTGRRKVDMRHAYMKYDGRPPEPPYDTEAAPSSCTVESIVLCPVCQRGDVWQEAVNRTEYVYNGEAVKDGQEVIDYLLAEVSVLLETQNAANEPRSDSK